MSSGARTARRSGLALLLGGADEPAEPPPPPFDVEAVRAEAFAAGRAAGLAEGLADGAAAVAPERERLRAAVAAFEAARAIDGAALAPLFAQLATRLAEAVVGAELRLGPDVVLRLAQAALAAAGPGAAALRAHPRDAALLRAAGTAVTLIEDAAMPPGDLLVEGGDWVVADGISARLAAVLGSALGDGEGEP